MTVALNVTENAMELWASPNLPSPLGDLISLSHLYKLYMLGPVTLPTPPHPPDPSKADQPTFKNL